MALARTRSVVVVGVAGHLVEVEADISAGLPAMAIVGLPDAAVAEARDRARAAVNNSGAEWPNRRITVGLSPATLHKHGSGLDLAIAVAVLAAAGCVPLDRLAELVVVGELGLDGRVRPVRGVLTAALTAREAGAEIVVPVANAREAALVAGLTIHPVERLADLIRLLRDPDAEPVPLPDAEVERVAEQPNLRDVRGQADARAGLEIAAAGGHHVAMIGPPGIGKTLLASRLPGILPPLDDAEAVEVTAIHSIAGRLGGAAALLRHPPFVAPHHTASEVAMVGGGSGTPRLGLVSLAHRGVLFLDETPEFAGSVLEVLRQPMESGEVVISRSGYTAVLPARFQLVLAANPCPCGLWGAPGQRCDCTSLQRRRYLSRLSGPLLDRVDVRLQLSSPTLAELQAVGGEPESTAVVADRVRAARERARARLAGTPWQTNAAVPAAELRRRWPLPADVLEAVHASYREGRTSARGLDRVVRLAWTVCDLAGHSRPTRADVATALRQRDGAGRWAA